MNNIVTLRVLIFAALAICGLGPMAISLHAGQASEMSTPAHQLPSVVGRALRGDGSTPRGACLATLRMELDRRGAPQTDLDSPSDGKTSFAVPLDQNGYFQFFGVPPGRHVLVVECPNASGVRELLVKPKAETRINPPVLLEDLTLDVTVTPKVDPAGKPWQVSVDATMPRLRRIVENATTSADGRWARTGLNTGNYRVCISSSDGKPWVQRFFNLSASSGPLLVRLPFMRLEGEVRLSTKPVQARLTFFNDAGGEPATLTSDDTGFFGGLVPVTPDAQKTTWTVEVSSTHPAISRRLTGVSVQSAGETKAWLNLALPVFAVHGTVVSQKGEPQSGVQVTFEDMSSGSRISTATSEDGGFELEDLSPGKYTAVAESIDGTSDRETLQVASGVESELKLVLNPSERIPFYVMSNAGPVANAAVQVWIAPGVPWFFTRTDEDGRMEVKLPPGTPEVGLTIGARGYALKMTRLRVPTDNDESPNDSNTITLDASGGTLMLDLQPPGRTLDSSATPYLVHDGAIEAAGTLVGWRTNQTYIGGGGPGVVEAIEPGDYALCFLADPAQLTTLWSGSLPSDRCRTGSVHEGDTLTLSPL